MTAVEPAGAPQPPAAATPADGTARRATRRAASAVRQMGEAAIRMAILRTLADTVAAEHTTARTRLGTLLRTANHGFGVKTIDVDLPGADQPIATVTLTTTADSITVADQAALQAWVAEHHPTRLVTTVDPGFLRQLLAEVAPDPDTGQLLHTPTGRVVAWARRTPGGPAYPTLRFTATGRDQIIATWRAGRLGALTPDPMSTLPTPAQAAPPPPAPAPADGTEHPPAGPTP